MKTLYRFEQGKDDVVLAEINKLATNLRYRAPGSQKRLGRLLGPRSTWTQADLTEAVHFLADVARPKLVAQAEVMSPNRKETLARIVEQLDTTVTLLRIILTNVEQGESHDAR